MESFLNANESVRIGIASDRFPYNLTYHTSCDFKRNFVNFITGRNSGGKPLLGVYDEYTETGRRGVYVLNINNDLYYYNDTDTDAIAQFSVKFRVTDPTTLVNSNFN